MSPGEAALAEWAELSESLLRGLIHALNNRVAALSAFAELAAIGDEELAPRRVLPMELDRLQQLSGLFRLLVSEEGAAEALDLAPVLEQALLLHAHHARLRTVTCEVVRAGAIPPVRVPRWALLRLLLVLIGHAKDASGPHAAPVLRVEGDEESVTLRVPHAGEPPHYAAMMTARCGGSLERAGGELVVRLPTLAARRRGER